MAVIGGFIIFIFFILTISSLSEGLIQGGIICFVIFLLGIGFCVIDLKGSYTETERIIITTEYQTYGIKLEGNKLCKIKITTKTPDNKMFVCNSGSTYTLLSFEDIKE